MLKEVLIEVAGASGAGHHSYRPNIGYPSVRQAVAEILSGEQGVEVTANEVIMTCGAAGALNVILKAIIGPGLALVEEVVTIPGLTAQEKNLVQNRFLNNQKN